MKELVIISGKGGTGKTSIAGAFAVLANNKILVDCDVDAADLHLLLKPEIEQKETFIGGKIAEINLEKCVKCGMCKSICRFDAIQKDFIIDPIDCEGCAVCYYICPQKAINLKDNVNAKWYVSKTQTGPMIHATMTVGSENSGKLVTLLRTQAAILSKNKDLNLIIIDGSPGIGCPVIASITSAHYCLIITEPTLSGQHDLKRVLELTKGFNIKTFVCINKFDINPDIASEIEDYCKINDIKVSAKIPYDLTVTRAQVEGKSIIDYPDSIASQEIIKLFNDVINNINKEK